MAKPKFVSRDTVLDNLHAGGRLILTHTKSGAEWVLLGGGRVKAVDATNIIKQPDIVGACDGLFPGSPQTFHHRKKKAPGWGAL